MSELDITIVITSFKSDKIIRDCLRSINRKYRVIIVENSNNVEFKNNLESEFDNVECILTGENLGYGKSNNIGIKNVKTKYLLILNPDCTLYESTLENFNKCLSKASDFAIIAPHTQTEEKKIIDLQDTSLISVENVKGFAMFFKLSEFKDIGFFDERFFMYFEDIDLCKRLINAGKKIYLARTIKILHEGGQYDDDEIKKKEIELSRNWHWMWSTFNYHKKYKGFFISFLIVLPKLITATFKFLIYSLLLKKEKRNIYFQRFSGLINAIKGKRSWYRPKV